MNTDKPRRLPSNIISYAVWSYYGFNLGHRDIEDLLAEQGITVSYETIRLRYPKHSLRSWGRHFKSTGPAQRFVTAHAVVQSLFNLGRHLVSANHTRRLRVSALSEWSGAVA